MKKATGLFAFGLALTTSLALAHNGATGVVLERMNGMAAMRDVIRDLLPVIQGEVPYDALAVSEGGYLIASHAGDTMRALFPEGSMSGVTYAKPNIWAEWQDFTNLAEELRLYGEALTYAAAIGLETPATVTSGAISPGTIATAKPADTRAQEIADLMGYSAPSSLEFTSTTTPAEPGVAPRLTAEFGAEDVFSKISNTCSACHARFRKGRS